MLKKKKVWYSRITQYHLSHDCITCHMTVPWEHRPFFPSIKCSILNQSALWKGEEEKVWRSLYAIRILCDHSESEITSHMVMFNSKREEEVAVAWQWPLFRCTCSHNYFWLISGLQWQNASGSGGNHYHYYQESVRYPICSRH